MFKLAPLSMAVVQLQDCPALRNGTAVQKVQKSKSPAVIILGNVDQHWLVQD